MTTKTSPESLLARAYDNLVELETNLPSFRREASSVAEFIELYIRNLFGLSGKEFKTILRQNRELHAKADRKEQRGKDPADALRVQMRQNNTFGKLLRRYSNHLGALDCILDTKATAALVHQIQNLPLSAAIHDHVTGCEFGSGTGILAVAGTIPFVRKQKSIAVHTFEQSTEPGEDAMKIVEILLTESKYRDHLEFHLHKGDITTPEPYKIVRKATEQSGPLALWISETFGFQTRTPVISEDLESCSFANPDGTTRYSRELEEKYDPFPLVLEHSCDFFDHFLKNIHNRKIIAFPDIVTPRVIINGRKSAFLAPDGTWRKLHRIGQPYEMLPPCVPSRWYIREHSRPARKKTFRKPIRKKKKKK